MTDREYLAEAREWLEEVKKLAGLAKDEKLYQKRLSTLKWLIQQARKEKRRNEWISKERNILEERMEKSDYGPERIYILGRIEALDELEDILERVEGK